MSSLRLLLRVVLATVAIIVCGAIARTGAGPRTFLAHAIAASAESAPSSEPTPSPDDHCRHRTDVAECKAVESDFDDDDDRSPRFGVAHHEIPSPRSLPTPARSHHSERGEPLRDPSCFAAGNGLPRGPPV